jgi:uncharacterized OB-fold protein
VPEARAIAPERFTVAGGAPRLVAARCGTCARLHFPATEVCPYCGDEGCTRASVGPDARLFLFTIVKSPPPGHRGPLPYGFGVVELPEGLRIVTRLTETRLDALREGLPVTLVVEPLFTDDDGTPVLTYAFAPAVAAP